MLVTESSDFSKKSPNKKKNQRKTLVLRVIFAVFPLFFASCPEYAGETGYAMGTICRVNLYEGGKPAVYSAIFQRFTEIDAVFSANSAESELEKVNIAAGSAPVPVSEELFSLLQEALRLSEASGEAFNPAIGPLSALWAFSAEPRLPGEAEIAAAMPLCNPSDIDMDAQGQTVFLRKPGMRLDLGALVKGYAAGWGVEIARKSGVKRALIDLGGNIAVLGAKGRGKPWRIGVQNPETERGAYLGVITGENLTVVTSGTYERFFETQGRRFHHILSTESGYPVENGLASVTIALPLPDGGAEKALVKAASAADALSTACFVLGYENSIGFLENTTAACTAIFVGKDKTVRTFGTGDFRGAPNFHLLE